MRYELIEGPAVEPLTPQEVRDMLGLPTSVSDTKINSWIKSGRQKLDGIDGMLGRALITQTWDWYIDGFPWYDRVPPYPMPWYWEKRCLAERIRLPLPPMQSVEHIKYLDTEGVWQTVDPDQYHVIPGNPGYVEPEIGVAWPTAMWNRRDAVVIRFVAGYGDEGEDVPEPIRQAILMNISMLRSSSSRDLFVSREDVDGLGVIEYSAGVQSGRMVDAEVGRLVANYRVYTGVS